MAMRHFENGWTGDDSQSRIDRFAFQRQHPKDRFMDATQRFFANEPFECFDAEREFAESQRSLRGKAARTETFEIFCRRVFRAVDDAEIFATATLHSRLHKSATIFGDELQRLHDHAFAAAPG